MRILRLLLLGCVLFWAQLALAAHGIEHALHEPDASCVECLALPGFAAAPAQTPPLAAPAPAQTPLCLPLLPAPIFTQPRAFHSRAPPRPPGR